MKENRMVTDQIFDVYRCKGCTRIVTKLQILEMMKTGKLCPCGSGQITPCDLFGFDWLLPRVWKLVYYRLMGKLAPPPPPSVIPPRDSNG
jgi:hypothetical protein